MKHSSKFSRASTVGKMKRASHTNGPLISRNAAFLSMDAGGKGEDNARIALERKGGERDEMEEHQFSVGQASN